MTISPERFDSVKKLAEKMLICCNDNDPITVLFACGIVKGQMIDHMHEQMPDEIASQEIQDHVSKVDTKIDKWMDGIFNKHVEDEESP